MERTLKQNIAINPDLAEIRAVRAWLDQYLSAWGISKEVAADMALVAEEVLANIIDYNTFGEQATIEVVMRVSTQRLELTFLDPGKPFNPLDEIESPDLSAGANEREAGGFGFFLVQELSDGVDYGCEEGRNRLTVVRILDKGE